MPNGTYGGVRGRKTKVGRKLLRFPPTRFRMSHAEIKISRRFFRKFLSLYYICISMICMR